MSMTITESKTKQDYKVADISLADFGRIDDLDALTWERTEKANALKQAVK